MRQELKGFLFVVLAASLWGMAGTVAKYLFNKDVNPLILVEVRLCLAALILGSILLVFARPQLSIDIKDIPYLVTLGIFGVAGVQFAYFFTISQTNVATAVFLQYISPVMVALYAILFQKEKLGLLKVVSLTLAIAGSYFMVFSQGLSVTPLGLISGLASAVFVSIYTIYGRRGLQKYTPWTLLFYCFLTGALAAFFVVPPWRIPIDTFTTSNMLFFVYIAIFATIIPFGSYFLGLRHLKATTAGITATLEPVVAALSAFVVLSEKLTLVQTMGAAMVLASVIVIQMSKPQGGTAKHENTEAAHET
ncbi:MAG TPA: DMT family transporter, partial [Verrucomicrobiae bacterium]|nr:DMT family transporter [Verrucomicrobiae bacterium]